MNKLDKKRSTSKEFIGNSPNENIKDPYTMANKFNAILSMLEQQ